MTHSTFDSAGAPAARQSIEVSMEDGGKLLIIQIAGKLHKDDYQDFVPVVERAVQENGKVRILVQVHDFHGWDASALWQDVKFDAVHFNHIERLAIVADRTWEEWMAKFCHPFTTATIRYFPAEELAAAHAWIAEK